MVVSLPGLEVFPGDLLISDGAAEFLYDSASLQSSGQIGRHLKLLCTKNSFDVLYLISSQPVFILPLQFCLALALTKNGSEISALLKRNNVVF